MTGVCIVYVLTWQTVGAFLYPDFRSYIVALQNIHGIIKMQNPKFTCTFDNFQYSKTGGTSKNRLE